MLFPWQKNQIKKPLRLNRNNEALIEELKIEGITENNILCAIKKVPREIFVEQQFRQQASIILTLIIKIYLLKKEVFLNGLLTQCTLLLLPCFLALLFLQAQKQCLYLLHILILVCGYIISAQRKKILKLYTENNK